MAIPGRSDSDISFSASLEDNVSPQAARIEKRLQQLGASDHEIKMMMRAVDEASPKAKAAKKQFDALPKEHKIRIDADHQRAMDAMAQVRKEAAKPAEMQVKVNSAGVDQQISGIRGRFENMFKEIESTAGNVFGGIYQRVQLPVGGLRYSSGGMLGAAGVGLAAAGGIGATVMQQSLQVNSQMEQNLVTLQQTMKDTTAATQEMGGLVDFAKKTPFQYQDVLGADVRLRSYGIEPGSLDKGGWLKSAGDMAAALQTPITQAVEAIADARQGYFIRMMSYGVRMMREDFEKGGKYAGMTYEEGLKQAIKRFEGSMEMQSRTLQGVTSNIKDIVQQNIIRRVGTGAFGIVKEQAVGLESKLNDPEFQRQLGKEVEKVQEGVARLWNTIQKGKAYFEVNLKDPLTDIVKSIIEVGQVFATTFGKGILVGVETLGKAFVAIVEPITGLLASMPALTQAVALFKVLQVFGLSGSVSDPFKGLMQSLNPLTFSLGGVLKNMKDIVFLIPKLTLIMWAKSIIDMISATNALNDAFQDMGGSGEIALDKLHAKLTLVSGALGESASQMKEFAAQAANLAPEDMPFQKRMDFAYQASKQMAIMDKQGMGGDSQQLYLEQLTRNGQYGNAGALQASAQVQKAVEAAAAGLEISLDDAASSIMEAQTLFTQQLAGRPGKQGLFFESGVTQAYGALQQPGIELTNQQLKMGYTNAQELMSGLLEQSAAPSQGQLEDLLAGSGFGGTKGGRLRSFYDLMPPSSGMVPSGVDQTGPLRPDWTRTDVQRAHHTMMQDVSAYQKTIQSQQEAEKTASEAAGMPINLPHARDVYKHFDLGIDPGAFKSVEGLANEWIRLGDSVDMASKKLSNAQANLGNAQTTVNTLSSAQESVNNQMTVFQHGLTLQQRAIQDASLAMNKYSFDALRPLQREMTRLQNTMSVYQHDNILPIQRQQEDWNQVMTRTSNSLSDVSFKLGEAQYEMSKFQGGLLKGEQATLDNLHALDRYNKQLQLLKLQNMGMMADLTRSTFRQGFTSVVKPLLGLSLEMQIQKAQREQQMQQLEYELNYGEKHYQLDQAARTKFQKQEMSYDERLQHIKNAVDVIDAMNLAQHHLQKVQYQQSLVARDLQEQMYEASKGMRVFEDQQFGLGQAMFTVNENLSDMQDNITGQQLAYEDAARGARKFEDAQYAIGQAMYSANKELLRANQEVAQWETRLTQQKVLMEDVGNAMRSLFGDQGMRQMLKWAEKTGFLSDDQIAAIKANLESPHEQAAKTSVGFWESAWGQIKQGFIGMFTGDTWVRISESIKRGFDIVTKSLGFEPGPIGTGLGIIGSTAIVGYIANVMRVATARIAGSILTSTLAATAKFVGPGALGEGLGKAASFTGEKLTKAAYPWEQAFSPAKFGRNMFWGTAVSSGVTMATGNPLLGFVASMIANFFPLEKVPVLDKFSKGLKLIWDGFKGISTASDAVSSGLTRLGTAFRGIFTSIREFFSGSQAVESIATSAAGSKIAEAVKAGSTASKVLTTTPLMTKLRSAIFGAEVPMEAVSAGGPLARAVEFFTKLGGFLSSIGTRLAGFTRLLGKIALPLQLALDASSVAFGDSDQKRTGAYGLVGAGLGAIIGGAVTRTPGGAVYGAQIGGAAGYGASQVDWNKVSEVVIHAINSIPDQILKGLKYFSSGQLAHDVGFIVGRGIRAAIRPLLGIIMKIGGWVSNAVSNVGEVFKDAINAVRGFFTGGDQLAKIQHAVGFFFSHIGGWIEDGVLWTLNAAKNAFTFFFENILQILYDGLTFIPKQLASYVGGLFQGLGFAGGMDRVPWDDMIVNVHKDEAILTAAEANLWRQEKHKSGINVPNDRLVSDSSKSVIGGTGVSLGGTSTLGTIAAQALEPIERAWKEHFVHIRHITKDGEENLAHIDERSHKEKEKNQKHSNKEIVHQVSIFQDRMQDSEKHHQKKLQHTIGKSQDDIHDKSHKAYDKLSGLADKGFDKTHHHVDQWSDKIDSRIGKTDGKLTDLGKHMDALGIGTGGATDPTSDTGVFHGVKGAQSFQKQYAQYQHLIGNDAFSDEQKQQYATQFGMALGQNMSLTELQENIQNYLDSGDPFSDQVAAGLQQLLGQKVDNKHTKKPGHAGGWERIPADGISTVVHQDEAILTAAQANNWRQSKNNPMGGSGEEQNARLAKFQQEQQDVKTHQDKMLKLDDTYKESLKQRENQFDNKHKETRESEQRLERVGFTDHQDKMNKILTEKQKIQQTNYDKGWRKIDDITDTWIGKVQKQIKGIDDDLGLTTGDQSDSAGDKAPKKAYGGLISGDKYDGSGQLIRVGEEGFDEVVIPLAPHRRDRAISLMEQTSARIGGLKKDIQNFAGGGMIQPRGNDDGAYLAAKAAYDMNAKGGFHHSHHKKGGHGTSSFSLDTAKQRYNDLWNKASYLFGAGGEPAPDAHFGAAVGPEAGGSQGMMVLPGKGGVRNLLIGESAAQLLGMTAGKKDKEMQNKILQTQSSLLHEWAHVYQDRGLLPQNSDREGGASLFQIHASQNLLPGLSVAANAQTDSFIDKYGGNFWEHDQFGQNWGTSPLTAHFGKGGISHAGLVAMSKLQGKSGGDSTKSAPGSSWEGGSGSSGTGTVLPQSAMVPIPGQPGQYIHPKLLTDAVTLIKLFKLGVNAGWAPPGTHTANSDHYWGGAMDLVPGPGGSWPLVTKLAHLAEPVQNQVNYPFRWVGYEGDANHGIGDHLHLSWLMGASGLDKILSGQFTKKQLANLDVSSLGGAGAAVKLPKVPKDLLKHGPVGAKLYKAYQKKKKQWEEKAGASAGGAGGGLNVATGPIQQMAREMVLRAWGQDQWPPFVWLEEHEANWDPHAQNPSSSAYGLAQNISPSTYPPAGQPGSTAPLLEQAKAQLMWMVKYIQGRYPGGPEQVKAGYYGGNLGGPAGYAGGINDVPYDNFRAVLHKDERVLTAAENNLGKSMDKHSPEMRMLGAIANNTSKLLDLTFDQNKVMKDQLRHDVEERIRQKGKHEPSLSDLLKKLKGPGSTYTSEMIDDAVAKYEPMVEDVMDKIEKAKDKLDKAKEHKDKVKKQAGHQISQKEHKKIHQAKKLVKHAKKKYKKQKHNLDQLISTIEDELLAQGVDQDVIDAIIASLLEEDFSADEDQDLEDFLDDSSGKKKKKHKHKGDQHAAKIAGHFKDIEQHSHKAKDHHKGIENHGKMSKDWHEKIKEHAKGAHDWHEKIKGHSEGSHDFHEKIKGHAKNAHDSFNNAKDHAKNIEDHIKNAGESAKKMADDLRGGGSVADSGYEGVGALPTTDLGQTQVDILPAIQELFAQQPAPVVNIRNTSYGSTLDTDLSKTTKVNTK